MAKYQPPDTAAYNLYQAEKKRGIVHTVEWKERMDMIWEEMQSPRYAQWVQEQYAKEYR